MRLYVGRFVVAACMGMTLTWTANVQAQDEAAPAVDAALAPEENFGAFPAAACRAGYFPQGPRLCMTSPRGPNSFTNANLDCQDIRGRLADYHDWRYRIFRGDGIPAPVGFWIGPQTGDNEALFVNLPNIADFDGVANRFDSRQYTCAHDVF